MKPPVLLGAIVAAAAVAGVVISVAQRPRDPLPLPTATPAVAPTPIPRGPIAGFGFSVADDPSTGQVVLFGGVGNDDNTWIWNGSRWQLASPADSPPGRVDAAAAYDPLTQQVLLFGGRHAPFTGGPLLNDTWAWSGRTWQELNAGGAGPAAGEGASMAWDDALNEMVLVTAGRNATGDDETWIWSRTHWVLQIHGSVSPGAFNLPMAFDPITRSLIAEGCCKSPASPLGPLDITWSWSGSRWLQLAYTAQPLTGSHLALDPGLGRLVLCNCGPMLGLPVLASWTRSWLLMTVARLPVEPAAEVADRSRGQLLLLGSATPSNQDDAQPVNVWSLQGVTWRQLDAVASGNQGPPAGPHNRMVAWWPAMAERGRHIGM